MEISTREETALVFFHCLHFIEARLGTDFNKAQWHSSIWKPLWKIDVKFINGDLVELSLFRSGKIISFTPGQ